MSELTILVVLQNAYDRGRLEAGGSFNPSVWRREFEASRTGRRFSTVIEGHEDACEVRYCNAAPGIGSGSRSRLTASQAHLRRALRRTEPDLVVACGSLAEEALVEAWEGDLIAIPHPAYMCLTNALLVQARDLITSWRDGVSYRVALRQKKGRVEHEELG